MQDNPDREPGQAPPRRPQVSPELDADRAILDQLLDDAFLYHLSKECKGLLDFACQLRNFAPNSIAAVPIIPGDAQLPFLDAGEKAIAVKVSRIA